MRIKSAAFVAAFFGYMRDDVGRLIGLDALRRQLFKKWIKVYEQTLGRHRGDEHMPGYKCCLHRGDFGAQGRHQDIVVIRPGDDGDIQFEFGSRTGNVQDHIEGRIPRGEDTGCH